VRPLVRWDVAWQAIETQNRITQGESNEENARRGPDGRRASSFFGLITFSKTIYELSGLKTSLSNFYLSNSLNLLQKPTVTMPQSLSYLNIN
jgi:hypothetical protein